MGRALIPSRAPGFSLVAAIDLQKVAEENSLYY